jgi:hypothetical protein
MVFYGFNTFIAQRKVTGKSTVSVLKKVLSVGEV